MLPLKIIHFLVFNEGNQSKSKARKRNSPGSSSPKQQTGIKKRFIRKQAAIIKDFHNKIRTSVTNKQNLQRRIRTGKASLIFALLVLRDMEEE